VPSQGDTILGTTLPVGNRFPPKRLAKASASSGLPKQKHHEVAVIAAEGVRQRRCRFDTGRSTLYRTRTPFGPRGLGKIGRPSAGSKERIGRQWGEGARSVRAHPSAKNLATGNVFGGMFNPAHHRRVLLVLY
jgi:hypothetical protein